MKKKMMLVLSAVFVITISLFYFMKRTGHPPISQGELITHSVETQQSAVQPAAPIPAHQSQSSFTEAELKSFRKSIPDKNEVKEEVRKNPHATPKSLIDFAQAFAPLFEKSINNQVDASVFIDELDDCVSNESVPQSARAQCLLNAEKLSKIHPQLKEKTNKIRKEAPRDVKKLL